MIRTEIGRGVPPLLVDVAAALGVAAVLLPWTHLSLAPAVGSQARALGVLGAFGLLHASVALRRTAPNAGYAVACAAILVVVLSPNQRTDVGAAAVELPMLFLPSSLAFLVSLQAVGAQRNRRLALAGLGVAILGALLASVRAGAHVPSVYPALRYRVYLTAALLLAVTAVWWLGRSRRLARERGAEQRVEATRRALTQERTRIAADLHDVVSHSLAVIVRQAEGASALAGRSPERAVPTLATIADVGRDALADMRALVRVLGDSGSECTDPSPLVGLQEVPRLLATVARTGVSVTLQEEGTRWDVGGAVERAAHHVVREALTNVVKHCGPGTTALVRWDWEPDRFVVEVTDDGGARRPGVRRTRRPGDLPAQPRPTPLPGAGVGLVGLRERVAAHGGTLTVGAGPGGFSVRADFRRPGRERSSR